MPGGNSGPGKFQLGGKRSFRPAIGSSGHTGNGHLHGWGSNPGNDHGYPGQWRDVYGKSFLDLQLNDVQLNAL